jgi:hypothetical protein
MTMSAEDQRAMRTRPVKSAESSLASDSRSAKRVVDDAHEIRCSLIVDRPLAVEVGEWLGREHFLLVLPVVIELPSS